MVVAAAVGAALVGLAQRSYAPDALPGSPSGPARPVASVEPIVPSSGDEPVPLGDVVVAAPLTGLDVAADGVAELRRSPGGPVVRLSSLDIGDGRGYVVYLVPERAARTPADGVFLGPLKGLTGAQNYLVPVGARLDGPLTVLVWSRDFKGPVGHASLRR